jgi:hypothetical protein
MDKPDEPALVGMNVAAVLTTDVAGVGATEPGSAMWHAQLLNAALERENSRLSSRGSQRLGSSHSSRAALSSREGLRKGSALSSLQTAEWAISKAVADHPDSEHARTARAKLQTTEPKSPGKTWHGKPENRPSTTGNPREMRMKLSLWKEGSAGIGSQRPPPLQGPSKGSPQAAEEKCSPMTKAEKQEMIQNSLTSFRRYFKEMPVSQLNEIPAPSSVQSASVEAYFEFSGSDMSDEELLETLARRPSRYAVKAHPRVPQNELFFISQRAEQLGRHRQQEKGHGIPWGTPKKPRIQTERGKQSNGVEFKSTGLFVHTELERLRTVDESRKNDKPEQGRVAHCCSLLERLQVKYFDEEVGMLKEELFRAIFKDSEALKRMPVPRNKEAFLNAKPFFELWQQERDRMDALQLEIKKYKAEVELQESVNQHLQARVKLLSDLSGKGGGGGGLKSVRPESGGTESGARTKSQQFESEASLSQSMLRGSISTSQSQSFKASSSRQSLKKLPQKLTPENSLRGDANWPNYAGESERERERGIEPDSAPSFHKTRPQPQSMSMPASMKQISFRGEARVPEGRGGGGLQTPKEPNPFIMAAPRVKLVASEIDNFEDYLRMQRQMLVPGDRTDSSPQHGLHVPSFSGSDQGRGTKNEGDSEHDAPHSVGAYKTSEENREVEPHPRADEGDEEGNGRTKAPRGHTFVMGQKMRRRKGVNEPRWRDFSIYLSRHQESCFECKEKLNVEYDKWRVTFDYKAPFPAMLRALERHKQIEVVGDANDLIVYSKSLGQILDHSSDEEEDLEQAIGIRECRIVKLQMENAFVKGLLEEEMANHTHKLEQRMEELEQLSDQIFESRKKNFEEREKILQDRVQELEKQLQFKERELNKVKYLLQDGDSLAAKLQVVTEEAEAAAVRFARREKQLLDITHQDKETIERLQKQIDVSEVIMKTGRDQLKIKVGFSAQRIRTEEQIAHQMQLREIERLFHEKLQLAELKGNVGKLTVKMSEKRFNVIMDILQRLDERVEAAYKTVLDTAVRSSVLKSLVTLTKTEFSDARLRLLQQVTVATYDSDSDAEYHNPEVGGIRTSEVQTDLTPANFGLEEEPESGGKKKGKKGGEKKGKKGKKKLVEDPLAPVDPEKVRLAQGLVDVVYQQLEPTLASSLGPPVVPLPDNVRIAVMNAETDSGASQVNSNSNWLARAVHRLKFARAHFCARTSAEMCVHPPAYTCRHMFMRLSDCSVFSYTPLFIFGGCV